MLRTGLAILVTSLIVCAGCSPNEMEVADTTGDTKIGGGASRTHTSSDLASQGELRSGDMRPTSDGGVIRSLGRRKGREGREGVAIKSCLQSRAAEDVRPYHARARIGEARKIGCEEAAGVSSRRAE